MLSLQRRNKDRLKLIKEPREKRRNDFGGIRRIANETYRKKKRAQLEEKLL